MLRSNNEAPMTKPTLVRFALTFTCVCLHLSPGGKTSAGIFANILLLHHEARG